MEKLGTENIKEVSGALIEFAALIVKSYNDDKKVDTGEAIKIVFKALQSWKAAKKIKPAIEEGKDIDPDEAIELAQWLLEKLKEIDVLDIPGE